MRARSPSMTGYELRAPLRSRSDGHPPVDSLVRLRRGPETEFETELLVSLGTHERISETVVERLLLISHILSDEFRYRLYID